MPGPAQDAPPYPSVSDRKPEETANGAPPGTSAFLDWARNAPRWAGPLALGVVVFVVFLPALGTQYIYDDFIHQRMLEGIYPGHRASFDLYNFVDDGNRDELLRRGLLPWWTHPELQLRFFRPLSAWLIAVDYTLFAGSPLAMHLHTFFWWALTIVGARRLYREFVPARVAALATFVFVLAPFHAAPVSWLANRDALLSLGFGVWGMVAWSLFKRGGSRWLVPLSFVLFSLSFASGEYALCITGYALGLELAEPTTPRRRALGLATFLAPLSLYMVVRTALDYGARGSGFYTDPLVSPQAFLLNAPHRLVVLFVNSWLALEDDAAIWRSPLWVLNLVGLALALVIGAAFRHALKGHEQKHRAVLVAFAVASIVALIPVLPGMPVQRVLGASLLGIAPLAASIMDAAWFRTPPGARRGLSELTGTVAVLLGFLWFVHAPIRTFLACERNRTGSMALADQARTLHERSGETRDADIVIVRGMASANFLGYALEHDALPRRYRMLAQCRHLLLIRHDERRFELVGPTETGIVAFGDGNLYLDATRPLEEGAVYPAPGMTVTVTDVEGGLVMAAMVELDEPLEGTTFFNEREHEYEYAEVPPIGFGAPFDYTPGELTASAPGTD
jgi:hypothetical protein